MQYSNSICFAGLGHVPILLKIQDSLPSILKEAKGLFIPGCLGRRGHSAAATWSVSYMQGACRRWHQRHCCCSALSSAPGRVASRQAPNQMVLILCSGRQAWLLCIRRAQQPCPPLMTFKLSPGAGGRWCGATNAWRGSLNGPLSTCRLSARSAGLVVCRRRSGTSVAMKDLLLELHRCTGFDDIVEGL